MYDEKDHRFTDKNNETNLQQEVEGENGRQQHEETF